MMAEPCVSPGGFIFSQPRDLHCKIEGKRPISKMLNVVCIISSSTSTKACDKGYEDAGPRQQHDQSNDVSQHFDCDVEHITW